MESVGWVLAGGLALLTRVAGGGRVAVLVVEGGLSGTHPACGARLFRVLVQLVTCGLPVNLPERKLR
jgi:hypothetical protein